MKTSSAVKFLATLIAGVALAPAAIAQTGDGPALSGFTCCNFHYENDWISDANWSAMPMIPAGTPIRTLEYGSNRVSVDIGGRRMRLGLDYGRRQRFSDWVNLMIVREDPKPKIAAWPEAVRNAVQAGKVEIGMTKEQVIVAVGYPPAHQTPSMESPQWKYWHTGFGTYLVAWDAAGRVRDVIADPVTRTAVLASAAIAPAAPSGAAGSSEWSLPAAGSSWVYELSDEIFRRGKTNLIVELRRADPPILEEHMSTGTGATRIATVRRDLDVGTASIIEQKIGANTTLMDFAPYLLPARGDKAWHDVIEVTGYPRGGGVAAPWVFKAHPPVWEQITVPAGTFRVARLEVEGRREQPLFIRDYITRFVITAWYSPDVKRFARLEHKAWLVDLGNPAGGKLFGHDLLELVSYRPPS